MLPRHFSGSLGCLFAASSLCSCAAEEAPSGKDGAAHAAARGSAASASPDGGQGQTSSDSAPEGGSQVRTFESLGLIACQTAAALQVLAAPACSSTALGCDASLAERLDELREACFYELNENAIEVFFDEGCVVGITEGRDDPSITTEAMRCFSEGIAKLRASCSRAVCIRLEHSTLAAL